MGKILSSFLGSGRNPFALVIKKTDETRVSDIVVANDAEIKFTANPNKDYTIRLWLITNSVAAADFDYKWTVPSGSIGFVDSAWDANTNTAFTDWTGEQFLGGNATNLVVPVMGRALIGVTGGEVNLQWAQNVSDVGDTTVKAGTMIEVYEY